MELYPQLAKQAEVTSLRDYIVDDNWIMEQKLDGHRVLLCSPGADMKPTALTRNGGLYSRRLPKEIEDFRFPSGDWVLDGELVGEAVNGHTVSSTYWIFDVLMGPGLPANSPLHVRRAYLETLLGTPERKGLIGHPFKLVPHARTRDEKIKLADHALRECYEGLVVKRRESPYRPGGRTPEWLKVKFVATADCIVLDVRDDGKDSVRLGLTDNGTIIDVGRASLIGKEKSGAIAKNDVIEVRYLYVGAQGRLYQPTIMRKRIDKLPHECTPDQLKFVNKSVMETL